MKIELKEIKALIEVVIKIGKIIADITFHLGESTLKGIKWICGTLIYCITAICIVIGINKRKK